MINNHELHVIIGTGPLGMAVMRELLSRGQCVRMVNRRGQANVYARVEVVKGDVTNFASAHEVCKDATVIYNCTGAPYTEWPEKFPPIIAGIIEGAAAAGAKLISADNLYAYGPVSGAITEDLPYAATERKGRTRAQMAMMLMEAHKSGKVQTAIGRASDFFGPGVLNSVVGERVFGAALTGKAANVLGNCEVPHTYTFIDDFAKGLVTLGQHEEALSENLHIPSAYPVSMRKILEFVCEEAGTTPKIRAAPSWLVTLLALFNPMMRELKETFYQFEYPFIVDYSKYEHAFGSDTTPHREAIRQTLEWFRKKYKI